MKKEGAVAFGFLISIIAILFFYSTSQVSSLTCSPNEVSNFSGCSGTYTSSNGGSCAYISGQKSYGLNHGIYCFQYNQTECNSENSYGVCQWFPGPSLCSDFTYNETACSTTSGCTPEYSCQCLSNATYSYTGTVYDHCEGSYISTTDHCDYRANQKFNATNAGVFCIGMNQSTCVQNSETYCQWVTGTPSTTYCSSGTYSGCLSLSSNCTAVNVSTYSCVANTCSDTDSPTLNYTQQGTITANTGISSGTDYCFESTNWGIPNATGDMLQEYSCNSTNSGVSSYTNCSSSFGAGYLCSAGACVNSSVITPGSLGPCEVGCTQNSDCLSGTCAVDISGTNRCVPSGSTCALATTSSCGVAQGTQKCYVDSTGDVKTCTSTGYWSTTPCGGYGCNQTNSTAATCKVPVYSTWWGDKDDSCNYVQNPYIASGDAAFKLVLRYGTSGIFNIFKNGGQINTSGGISSTCGDPVWVGSWDFLYNSLSPGESANYSFTINGNQSENLNITRGALTSGTYCGDGIVQKPNDKGLNEQCDGSNLNGITTCDQYNSTTYSGGNLGCFANGTANECQYDASNCQLNPSSLICDGKSVCGDYNSADLCNADLCRFNGNPLAYNTPPQAGTGKVDRCQWDPSTSKCNKVVPIIVNGKEIGTCTSKENPRTDDCSDGFLSYTWNSTWNWSQNNPILAPNGDGTCPTNSTAWNGKCHYDPNKDSQKCASGSSTISCPAQVQLSFFDWRNVLAAILIIFVLYVLLMKNKKKALKKNSKKQKRK